MSLKKLLPLIIVLISISLIGIIYLQYNRLATLRRTNDEQLFENVARAIDQVGKELSYGSAKANLARPRRRTSLSLSNELSPMELMTPVLLSERFTQFEVREKFDAAFKQFNVPVKEYEFAITNNLNLMNYEMQSPGFMKQLKDTINNRVFNYQLDPPVGTWAEQMAPYENVVIIIPQYNKLVFRQSLADLIGAIVFTLFIMFAFFLTVSTMINQKKLGEIKSDFINNMTHEFKTPLATISLAVDALGNEKVLANPDKREYFRGIIKDENKRMNKHVETILQAATMEKQELTLNRKPMHGHDLIHSTLDNYHLVLQEKQGRIQLNLNARHDLIEVDEQHFSNLINNLVDNAIKYSGDNPDITITTHSTQRHFIMRVDDRGIGMSRESVRRIFEKFYRAHTGNLHNVKGFGLGMSYVKTIIDAHKGRIKVDSTLGKGSSFTVEMPLAEQTS